MDSETFSIHATSENYDLVSVSEDLENFEELKIKGRDITIEKTVTWFMGICDECYE